MQSCVFANNFDGIDGVVSADSYNDFLCALDGLINDPDVNKDYVERFKELKYKLLKLSLFNPEGEEVHIRLGLKELSLYTVAMLAYLPDYDKDYFDLRINSEDFKQWHEPVKNSDPISEE